MCYNSLFNDTRATALYIEICHEKHGVYDASAKFVPTLRSPLNLLNSVGSDLIYRIQVLLTPMLHEPTSRLSRDSNMLFSAEYLLCCIAFL